MSGLYSFLLLLFLLMPSTVQQNNTDTDQRCLNTTLEDSGQIQCVSTRIDNLIRDERNKHQLRYDLYGDIARIKHHLNALFNATKTNTVAFYASKDTYETYYLIKGKVVFENVITNTGSGYDAEYGIFTAPVSGIYVFAWNICVKEGKRAGTHLLLNDKVVAKNWADSREARDKSDDSGTMLNVVTLRSYDEVWVEMDDGTYVEGDGWSSFSGWKIYDLS